MNWKLIFQLSIFGLIMAFGTISLIPQKFEPIFWLIIFAFCAWVIARACAARYFLHGLLVSLVNSVWITAVHLFFRQTYMADHPEMVQMNAGMPPFFSIHPRLAMIIMGPIFGVLSGIILGLFSLIASKIITKS